MNRILTNLLAITILSFYPNPHPLDAHVSKKSKIKNIILETKQIILDEYPDAFHPSIFKRDYGYIIIFRYCPNRNNDGHSYIGVFKTDENFDPISKPELLDLRVGSNILSQTEDARIFSVGEKIYIIYNDNPDVEYPTTQDRRDMFIVELIEKDNDFTTSKPLKLIHETKYDSQLWQKNWIPFDWNGSMLISYSISPHEVLVPDLETGICTPTYESSMNYVWKKGFLRGGTPAQVVGSKYLAFFHSSMQTASSASFGKKMHHYYMGAYTFSLEPPFYLKKISSLPIIAEGFYTQSNYSKRVIFPCAFVVNGDLIYLSYGKDDGEMWIATINKKALEDSLVPVN